MSLDYTDRQREHNAAYNQAYEEWVASLSPTQRRKLEVDGLLNPEVDSFKTGKQDDVSELPIAAPEDEIVLEDGDRIWEVLRHLLGELLSANNVQLSLECMALVSGVGFMGDSMTAIAKRHKVTRAAVSKRCILLTEQLELIPSRAMKSLTARVAYRNAQTKHYDNRERFDDGRRPSPGN